MPELLSPAGNPEKLEAALRFGADAVYLAGQAFGMRAGADNFSLEQLRDAVKTAHRAGARLYVTVNTMPRDEEYPALRQYLEELREIRPDALIVADIGVLMLCREIAPELEIHLSTQANAVSAAACRAWHALGVKRVVLARELSLAAIRAIRADTPRSLELEAFIHGSMCISYSGRCLLSGYLTGRDANRGMCTQPCRWNYKLSERVYELKEEKRPETPLPLEEQQGETFILSSRDTCMIEHIPELMESGIDSFKIEGRMKSAYYTAVVTNTYRMAMDAYQHGGYVYRPEWMRELCSVSHREYATGYYFSNPHENANLASGTGYLREKAYLAVVTGVNATRREVACLQRNKLSVGDSVELVTPGRTGVPFPVLGLFDAECHPIQSTPHPQMPFILSLPPDFSPEQIHAGDILRAGD